MLRFEPRATVALNDDAFLIADHGYIYKYTIGDNTISIEHEFKKGMKAPLSFCARYNDGVICDLLYGEYTQNTERDKVAVYRRKETSWEIVYEFRKGTIKHIHNIVDDPMRRRFLILTGDEDSESGIWEADYSFQSVNLIIGGSQQYRSCVLVPTIDGFYYLTDTPIEQNYLYKLSFDGKLTQLSKVPGPVIYGTFKDNILYFATTVEGDSRKTGYAYLLSMKLGAGVKDRYSHLFLMNSREETKEICCMKKDIFPLTLFEFGNMRFPETDNDDVYICPQSLHSKYGTYIIKKSVMKRHKDV